MFPDLGEIIFSVIVTYMGAIELFFVMKQLYHLGFQHQTREQLATDEESLKAFQKRLDDSIREASLKEIGDYKAMKDGVLYKDGFRVDLNDLKDYEKIDSQIILDNSQRTDDEQIENLRNVHEDSSRVAKKQQEGQQQPQQKQQPHNYFSADEANVKSVPNDTEQSLSSSLVAHVSTENSGAFAGDKRQIEEEVCEEPCVKKHVEDLTITGATAPPKPNESSLFEYTEEDDILNVKKNTTFENGDDTPFQHTIKIQEKQSIMKAGTPQIPPVVEPLFIKEEVIKPNEKQHLSETKENIKSEDSSSAEPISTCNSSLSNQKSSSLETSMSIPEMHFEEYEREAPDGQDIPDPPEYSEDYLRSLDGLKRRPIIRDDGSGRRRAFKKRRSSGDSTSSRESRASREEELKMFTSLEEEEFEAIRRGETEFVPIQYSSEPNLKVTKHSRRHKRSPVKEKSSSRDLSAEESKSSLEMLDEEDQVDPWGEVKPQHYKDTEFWKNEKAASIEEEDDITEDSIKTIPDKRTSRSESTEPRNVEQVSTVPNSPSIHTPKMSTFENATQSQHETVVSALKKSTNETDNKTPMKSTTESIDDESKGNVSILGTASTSRTSDTIGDSLAASEDIAFASNTNNTASYNPENVAYDQQELSQEESKEQEQVPQKPLRRSPRCDDMDRYEERIREQEEIEQRQKSISPSTNKSQSKSPSPTPLPENMTNTHIENIYEMNTFSSSDPSNTNFANSNTNLPTEISDIKTLTENILKHERSKSPLSPDNSVSSTFETPDVNNDFLKFETRKQNTLLDEHKNEQEDSNRPRTPIIAVDYAPDEDVAAEMNTIPIQPHEYEEYEEEASSGLLQGISDFYDFNASINPSRSPSVDRSFRRSKSPSTFSKDVPCNNTLRKSPSKTVDISGLSDFYDYNVLLNRYAYGKGHTNFREAHRDSIDYIEEELENNSRKGNAFVPKPMPSKNDVPSLPIDGGGKINSSQESVRSIGSTTVSNKILTDMQRSTSTNSMYLERMKDEYRNNVFKRSTYIGESMDFENDFEDLREKTRHFQRSRSKSRSPDPENPDSNAICPTRKIQRELQEKILEEITKTTINFQEFSRDINQEFLEYERRGSDSALLQKPELLIQIDDRRKDSTISVDDDDILDQLEAEEYHHFRRFSLNQGYQVEEYPEDTDVNEYMYIEKVEVCRKAEEGSWTSQKYYNVVNVDTDGNPENSSNYPEEMKNELFLPDNDEEDNETTDSDEDEKRTIIEVEDEIDEDIFDYEHPPEEYNEQSECEEADREIDQYAFRNADDWKEEGAVGGINLPVSPDSRSRPRKDSDINIEDMYDDAIKNTEESGLQKDYENIIDKIQKESGTDKYSSCYSGDFDKISIKTEDLLEEILQEDEKKYNLPRIVTMEKNESLILPKSKKELIIDSTQCLLGHEVNMESEMRRKSPVISSARLRSRYGLSSSTSYRNYDNLDVNVDISYKPKKEYNWRKNFKLDEDDNDSKENVDEKDVQNTEDNIDVLEEEEDITVEENGNFLDPRKYSLGGESIVLFSRSPRHARSPEIENENIHEVFNTSAIEENPPDFYEKEDVSQAENIMDRHTEIPSEEYGKKKKKKSKKKSRRDSKESFFNEEEIETEGKQEIASEYNEEIFPEDESSKNCVKKKRKSSKKSLVDVNVPECDPSHLINNEELLTLNNSNPQTPHLELVNDENRKKISFKQTSFFNSNSSSHTTTATTTITDTDTNRIVPQSISSSSEKALQSSSDSTLNSSSPENRIKIEKNNPDPVVDTSKNETSEKSNKQPRPPLQRNDSSGVYELIKDGSMYPWF